MMEQLPLIDQAQVHWADGPLLVLDTESTGTDYRTARMVSCYCAVIQPNGTVLPNSRVSTLVNPGVPIPPEAEAVHGLTTAMVEADGQPTADVIAALIPPLRAAIQAGWPLVIFNVRYDWPLLLTEAQRVRCHDPIWTSPTPPGLALLDPVVIDRTLDKYRRGSRKLLDCCGVYGVPLTEAHSADADAVATAGLMRGLIRRYPQLRTHSLPQMHYMQRVWFRQWRDGLNSYWRKQDKRDPVTGELVQMTGEWPVP